MPVISDSEFPLIVRVDFENEESWHDIKQRVLRPSSDEGFYAYVDFLEDKKHQGKSKEEILKLVEDDYDHGFIMIADETTLTQIDNPILVIDLIDEGANNFRSTPEQIQAIENNLSIMNMDFFEFAEGVSPDGTFRGFPKQ